MNRDKLLSKLQALLEMADLSRGATEAEAQAFLQKAHELMAKHGIEEMELADLTGDAPAGPTVAEERVDMQSGRWVADQYIYHILKKCFEVDCLFSTNHKDFKPHHTYILIGDPCDVAFARTAIPIMRNTMQKTLRAWLKARGETWKSVYDHSVCKGVCLGFTQASEQGKEMATRVLSKSQKEQYGLILVNKQDAIQLYKKENYGVLRSATRGRKDDSIDDSAFNAGYSAGKNMDLATHNKLN